MANTKSAIKTNRRIQRQTLVNKSRKSRYKTAIKKINLLIEKKDNVWIFSYKGGNDLRKEISKYAQKNNILILEMKAHNDKLEDLFKKLTK